MHVHDMPRSERGKRKEKRDEFSRTISVYVASHDITASMQPPCVVISKGFSSHSNDSLDDHDHTGLSCFIVAVSILFAADVDIRYTNEKQIRMNDCARLRRSSSDFSFSQLSDITIALPSQRRLLTRSELGYLQIERRLSSTNKWHNCRAFLLQQSSL